jgi:MFS family permease
MTQVIWITFAPITGETALDFFGSSDRTNPILLLSMVFMIAYIPINYPACRGIDKFGLKWGTGIGVILTGVFGLLRAVSINYVPVLIFQIGCALGQPFVLNSFTKVATNWFPEKEKTLATGLGTLAVLLGPVIGMMVTPALYVALGLQITLYIYGGIALFFMVLYLIFVRDKPPSPPNAYSDKTKVFETKGTRDLFKKKDFNFLFVLMFIGIGVFNAISSGVDLLFDDVQNLHGIPKIDAIGYIGGIMILGGIFGAVILSTLSDKFRKRKIFLILAIVPSIGLALLFFFIKDFIGLMIIAFLFGFLLISALPVGLTFAAEITYPIPEETSNGWLMWIGQISGILLILAVMFIPTVDYNFIIYVVLFVVGSVLVFLMKDLDAYELKS